MKTSQVLLFFSFCCVTSQAIFCRSCHSWNNTACVRTPLTVIPKDCPPDDNACATVLISATSHLFRGCSSDAECVTEGDRCVKCDEFGDCNSLLYPKDRLSCNICETSANANCATLPYYKQFEKLCVRHVVGDECVTIFDEFRVVRRECRSGLGELDARKCELGSNQCVGCRGVGCNKVTVREDDACLQCTSDVGNCANGKKAATVCGKVSDGVCYSRLNVDGKLHRGCLSDLTDVERGYCLDAVDRSCETCRGTGCNKGLFPANALQCVQCESETDGGRCVQRQVDDTLVNPCRLQVGGDKCYTRLHSDGTLDRGCYSSLQGPCDPLFNVTCTYCDGGACNREVYPSDRRSCFQCDGLSDLSCGLDQGSRANGSTVCRKYLRDDQCYTLLENGKVKRGCASEFEVDVCHGLERTQCQTCSEDHCNHVSEIGLRSGVEKNVAFSVLIMFSIAFLNLYLL